MVRVGSLQERANLMRGKKEKRENKTNMTAEEQLAAIMPKTAQDVYKRQDRDKIIAPILCFTSQEIWDFLPKTEDMNKYVVFEDMPKAGQYAADDAFKAKWAQLIAVRDEVKNCLLYTSRAQPPSGTARWSTSMLPPSSRSFWSSPSTSRMPAPLQTDVYKRQMMDRPRSDPGASSALGKLAGFVIAVVVLEIGRAHV